MHHSVISHLRVGFSLSAFALLLALLPTSDAQAQIGSLAIDAGIVGEMGEPFHGYGFAEDVKCRVRPQDEVWVISSRHLGWPDCESGAPALKYWRWSCDIQNWKKLPASEFQETDSATVATVMYVHGNSVDSWKAVDLGWFAYNAIVRQAENDRPVRFVIYSWASTRICGSQVNDLRCKANRSNAEAYYLGHVLSEIREDVPLGLVGFSYGSRVITGALHVANGGQLCGNVLPEEMQRRGNIRSVLMAAATHNCWMYPGCFHGRALESTNKMLILANSCDKVLRYYHWLFKGERPKALGVTGLSWYDQTGRVQELDCCCCCGKTHNSLCYLSADNLVHRMRQYVLWEEVE